MNSQRTAQESLPERSRLSRLFLPNGTEPDPRFTLANERTFLSWIRTALALLAAGIALEALSAQLLNFELRKPISLSLVTLAILISASACIRWLKIENALRARKPLPFPMLIPVLSIALLALTAVLFFRDLLT